MLIAFLIILNSYIHIINATNVNILITSLQKTINNSSTIVKLLNMVLSLSTLYRYHSSKKKETITNIFLLAIKTVLNFVNN